MHGICALNVGFRNDKESNVMKNIKWKYGILWMLIAVLHISLILFYGMKKEGFHEDEYYSYFTSAGYADILPSGHYDWRSGPELQEQFMVQEGERFQFDAVIQYQIEDVHPPLYYLCLNIFMSLFPGKFFKWFSILLNAGFSLIALAGITFFFYQISEEEQKHKMSLAAAVFYAVAPSTISNVMFARMYGMSAMWNVLYLCALYMAFKHINGSRKQFALWTICGAIICYLSFLTHYFSLLLPGLMTAVMCIYLLTQRKHIGRMFIYGLSMVGAIGLAVYTYPACLSHIFSGYRGAGVLNELNMTGFVGRIKFFTSMLNEYAAGNMLWWLLGIVLVFAIVFCIFAIKNRKNADSQERNKWFWYGSGLVSCVIACLVLMKISLYVYGAGCRFFFPVLAFMIPLMGCFVLLTISNLKKSYGEKIRIGVKGNIVIYAIACLMILLPYVKGHMDEKILFLYEEEAEKVAFSETHKECPVVLLCDRDNMQRTWYIANQLWPFYSIFYTDYEHVMIDSFDEPTIRSADQLIVFMDAPEEVVQKLVDQNPNLDTYTLVRHDPFYYVYLLE